MNYLREINAFYDRLETNPLSSSSIVLWHALMHINNKTGWIDTFTVAASVLCVKTGLSERTISNSRNELKQKGYIDFQSRKGNRSAAYRMVSLSAMVADKISDTKLLSANISDSVSDSLSDNTSDSVSDNLSTLFKQNESKRKETKDDISPDEFLKLINKLEIKCKGTVQLDELLAFRGLMQDELISEALRLSEKKSVAYTITILKGWNEEKIRTLEQLRVKQTGASTTRKLANVTVLADKLPVSIQKQIQREQECVQVDETRAKRTVMDDPELAELYRSLRGTGG